MALTYFVEMHLKTSLKGTLLELFYFTKIQFLSTLTKSQIQTLAPALNEACCGKGAVARVREHPFSSSREEQEPGLGTEQTQATDSSAWHWELSDSEHLNVPAVPCTREGFKYSPRKRDGGSQKYYTSDRRKLGVK